MKKILLLLMVLFLSVSLFAGNAKMDEADKLHENAGYDAEFKLLEGELASAGNNNDKSEILWRMSRAALAITDQLERDGASKNELLSEFKIAWDYATKSLSFNSDNYNAYYWRAANIGRWGQTKGILDSLFKADDMRDDLERAVNSNPNHGDSYHVLGMLYDSVPGIISFGNKAYAVSLARKAVDNQDEPDRPYDYAYYLELAKHLWNRKWKESKRISEQRKEKGKFESKSSQMEKNWFYDGLVNLSKATAYSSSGIKNMSDREEAVIILNWMLVELNKLNDKKPGDFDDIEEAKELLADWE
ncbi:MAG: hypothetical protein KAQ93_07295 [Spirochaetales bacterium]|nr:hypothetical protein [Spirochaetales bacterium]